MTAGTYLAGSVSIVAVVVALAWGATRLRRALLADWSGPPAVLAEVVMVVAVPVGLAQLLGSFGVLEPVPMLVGCLAVGVAMGLVGRRVTARAGPQARLPDRDDDAPRRSPREPRAEIVAATLAAALVASQWATHVAAAWGRGMTDGDTLWYHAPFAGRFVQTGKLAGLSDLATPLHAYLPLNSSLFQAIVILPFGNDFLAPLVNLAFAGLALLAAWCLGRHRGVGALCVLGAVVVLGLPTLVTTQPGSASNDLATGALFLAAVALLFEGDLAPTPTALAAVAAGIALGTKLTVAAPIAVLTVVIVVLALRSRRPVTAALWCGALAVSGGYWFVRNWVVNGSPVPYFEVELGPLVLESDFERNPTILDHVTNGDVWREFYLPGLSEAFGRAWPLLVTLALGGAALAVVRGRRPLERFTGVAALSGAIAYVAIPGTGDLGGGLFVFTLRYLAPVLLVGFALLALDLDQADARWRRAAWVAMVGLVVFNAFTSDYDNLPAWVGGETLVAVVTAGAVLAGAALIARARPPSRVTTAVLATAALVVAGGAGWLVQDRYFERRYVDAGLALDGANAVFRDVQGENVAVFGTEQLYPMFGADVSNRVSKVEGPQGGSDAELCAGWRDVLAAGDYRYIVMGHEPWTNPGPAEAWIKSDAAVTQVFRDRDAVVFRVDGILDPAGCA